MKKARKRMIFLAMAAMLAAPLSLSGCGEPASPAGTAVDLMSGGTAKAKADAPLSQEVSEKYQAATADFSLDLFRRAYQPGQNSLISPISAGIALGMTLNGANGNTQAQFLNLLGGGGLTQKELNRAYSKQIAGLSQGETGILNLASSIWFHKEDGFTVKEDFLQTNADSYQADAYQLDFSDSKTFSSINEWVSSKTNGKIEKLLEKPIDADTMMYLINTMYLEMDWETPFERAWTRKGEFETATGEKRYRQTS